MGYFNVTLKPDLVAGDISNIIAADKTDTPFTADDILFDWQAFDVPNGTVNLETVTAKYLLVAIIYFFTFSNDRPPK